MSAPILPALTARFQALGQRFIADYVALALDAAQDDGPALSFQENGMTEPTEYGQYIEDNATSEAMSVFERVLQNYLMIAAEFDPSGPYYDAAEHAGNGYKGAVTPMEQDALERICDAHSVFLRDHASVIPVAPLQIRDEVQFLLKSPLEFADHNSRTILTGPEQSNFSAILHRLRHLAAG